MRFSKSSWNVSPALLATAALILIAGVAGAVFDSNDDILPDSPNYNGSGGYVDASGNIFATGVYFMCADADNDFEIGCDSEHPDKVSLSTNTGRVDQRKNGNNAHAWMSVVKMGGIVEDTTFDLDCEKVQLKGKSNDKTDKIDAQCTLKKCVVPGGLLIDQVRSAEACIEDSEENGEIGKKVTTLKLDRNNLLGGKITSKGLRD